MINTLREKLKRFFVRGAMPTQANFAELIDSVLIKNEDGISTQSSQVGQKLSFTLPEHHQASAVFQKSVNIVGDLIVEGRLLVAPSSDLNYQQKLVSHQATGDAGLNPVTLPVGSILLFSGQQIPEGFHPCDGSDGFPFMTPPSESSTHPIHYIIKTH